MATLVLLLVNENCPLLFDIGTSRENAWLNVFVMLANEVENVDALFVTVKLAVRVAEAMSRKPACVAVTVAGVAPVPAVSVATRRLDGTDTFTYEMVPGKFSPAKDRHPPIVTGPLPITLLPTLNDELNDDSETREFISDAVKTLL